MTRSDEKTRPASNEGKVKEEEAPIQLKQDSVYSSQAPTPLSKPPQQMEPSDIAPTIKERRRTAKKSKERDSHMAKMKDSCGLSVIQ